MYRNKHKKFIKNIEARALPYGVTIILVVAGVTGLFFASQFVDIVSAGDNWDLYDTISSDTLTEGVSCSNDGLFVAFGEGASPYTVYVYWCSNLTLWKTLTDPTDEPRWTEFSDDDVWFAVASNDENVYIYNVSDGFSLETTITDSTDVVTCCDFSDDYIAYGTDESKVRIHWIGNWTEKTVITVTYDIQALAFTIDNTLLGFTEQGLANQGGAHVYWVSNFTQRWGDTGFDSKGCSFSPDGSMFAYVDRDQEYTIIAYSTNGTEITHLTGQSTNPHSNIFSRSGDYFACSGTIDFDVDIYWTSNWTKVTTTSSVGDDTFHMRFSTDDQYLYVCAHTDYFYIYNTTLPVYSGSTASSFTLTGLSGSRITFSGASGTIVWSNETAGAGGTLEINYHVNASDNLTEIRVNLVDIDVGEGILATNISLTFDDDNSSWTTNTVTYPGSNITINESVWDAQSWCSGSNPFPIDGVGWTNGTIYVHFKLDIDSGASAGSYQTTTSAWTVYQKVET